MGGGPLLYEAHMLRASEVYVRGVDGSQAETEDGLSVRLTSYRSLELTVGLYSIRMDVVDRCLDLVLVNTHCWSCLLAEVRPEGLLGRTWSNSVEHRTDDEAVVQYRERIGQLLPSPRHSTSSHNHTPHKTLAPPLHLRFALHLSAQSPFSFPP